MKASAETKKATQIGRLELPLLGSTAEGRESSKSAATFAAQLPLLGSNQDSSDPESEVSKEPEENGDRNNGSVAEPSRLPLSPVPRGSAHAPTVFPTTIGAREWAGMALAYIAAMLTTLVIGLLYVLLGGAAR